jgi:hypothetical protein
VGRWQETLDIRLYRQRPTDPKAKRAAQRFWAELAGETG